MGRPSKLTPAQWERIEKRLLQGEKSNALAREFKISGASIRGRFSAIHIEVKEVAKQILSAESSLRALPVSAQVSALNLLEEMRAISGHLAGAARFGSATAHRLAGIAHAKVQQIDDAAPLDDDSREAVRDVVALTVAANEAAKTGLNLLSATREQAVRRLGEEGEVSDSDDARADALARRLDARIGCATPG